MAAIVWGPEVEETSFLKWRTKPTSSLVWKEFYGQVRPYVKVLYDRSRFFWGHNSYIQVNVVKNPDMCSRHTCSLLCAGESGRVISSATCCAVTARRVAVGAEVTSTSGAEKKASLAPSGSWAVRVLQPQEVFMAAGWRQKSITVLSVLYTQTGPSVT